MSFIDRARNFGGALYRRVDARLYGAPSIFGAAFKTCGQESVAENAAGLAYYGLFALFPLLLVLIGIGTLFLGSKRAETELVNLLKPLVPGSQITIQQNLINVMQQRGSITWVGILVLLWSASGFFIALTRSLRRAWPGGKGLNAIGLRLSGILVVLALGLLFVLWSTVNVVLNAIPFLFPDFPGAEFLREWITRLFPIVIMYPMLIVLYRWTGRPLRGWRGILIAALAAAVALQTLVLGFGWYLGSGLANYELVYGSIAGVIALLLFAYFLSYIVLFGAHLAAAIDLRLASAAPASSSDPTPVQSAPEAGVNEGEGI